MKKSAQHPWYKHFIRLFCLLIILTRFISFGSFHKTSIVLAKPTPIVNLRVLAEKKLIQTLTPTQTTKIETQTIFSRIKHVIAGPEKYENSSLTVASVRGAEITLKPTHPADPKPTVPVLLSAISATPITVTPPINQPQQDPIAEPTLTISASPIPSPLPTETDETASTTSTDAPVVLEPSPTPVLDSPTPTAEPTIVPTATPEEASPSAQISF